MILIRSRVGEDGNPAMGDKHQAKNLPKDLRVSDLMRAINGVNRVNTNFNRFNKVGV